MSACPYSYGQSKITASRLRCKTAKGALAAFMALAWIGGCAERAPMPTQLPPQLTLSPSPVRAWSADQLADLRETARSAPAHGLWPEEEVLGVLGELEPLSLRDEAAAQRLDETADELFARLAHRFAVGAVDPAQADPAWRIPPPAAPDEAALRRAVADGADVSDTLAALLPQTPDYTALVAELARVQAEADEAVDEAGLSKATRIDRLRASLERWRWAPRTLPLRRIDVLVPFFELRARDGEASVHYAVIVGARRSQTPSFAAAIETVTLNPTWTPPSSIVQGELAPRFRRNPSAATAEHFDVIDRNGRLVDPAAVNWSARPFPYVLRQRAGPGNALGRLRFDLPNPYAVFIHDTPNRGLFARSDRALSHGCIRVSEPVALAALVIADDEWSEPTLDATIEIGATRTIRLEEPMPVYVLYLTAAPDQNGIVRYAEDIYERDAEVLRALAHEASWQAATRQQTETECALAH